MVYQLLIVATAAMLAQILTALIAPLVRVPLVVLEISLGIIIGPAVLGLVRDTVELAELSDFGLAMLFFMAGSEVEFRIFRGRLLRRSVLGWLVSLAAGVGLGIVVAGGVTSGIFIGIALCSTALGTLLPVLIDTGMLRTPLGAAVTAVGAMGEFGPLLAISIFLSSRSPWAATLVLVVFVLLAIGVVLRAAMVEHPRMHKLITATLHTSGQFAIRLVCFMLLALVALSTWLGLDMLLGAFAAGVAFQYLLAGARPEDAEVVRHKLAGLAFGFLVPIFFISTGVDFDITALFTEPQTLTIMLVFLVALLAVRGIPGAFATPTDARPRDRASLGLMAATGLPIIIAVTNIALDQGALPQDTATAMVGAGMLSVLLFPLIAVSLQGKQSSGKVPQVHDRPPMLIPRDIGYRSRDAAEEPEPATERDRSADPDDEKDGADGGT